MNKILIIEDESMNMRLATDILTIAGYSVLQAWNAEDGIELAREEQPNLILMDMQMPGLDPFKATTLLKQDEHTAHINIIAITAMAMIGDKEKILAAGADHYIAKPYKYQDLLAAVRQYQR